MTNEYEAATIDSCFTDKEVTSDDEILKNTCTDSYTGQVLPRSKLYYLKSLSDIFSITSSARRKNSGSRSNLSQCYETMLILITLEMMLFKVKFSFSQNQI